MDRDRCHVPISGTQIRKHALSAFGYGRIVCPSVAGSPCCTHRCGVDCKKQHSHAKLADHYQTGWVPSTAASIGKQKLPNWNDIHKSPQWSRNEFEHIAREQLAREEHWHDRRIAVLLCDTNAFATGTWFERYFVHATRWLIKSVNWPKQIFTCLPHPMSIRPKTDFAMERPFAIGCMNRFREQLAGLPAPHCLLHCNYDQRFRQAVAAFDVINPKP